MVYTIERGVHKTVTERVRGALRFSGPAAVGVIVAVWLGILIAALMNTGEPGSIPPAPVVHLANTSKPPMPVSVASSNQAVQVSSSNSGRQASNSSQNPPATPVAQTDPITSIISTSSQPVTGGLGGGIDTSGTPPDGGTAGGGSSSGSSSTPPTGTTDPTVTVTIPINVTTPITDVTIDPSISTSL